jgi:hypothetical protein
MHRPIYKSYGFGDMIFLMSSVTDDITTLVCADSEVEDAC